MSFSELSKQQVKAVCRILDFSPSDLKRAMEKYRKFDAKAYLKLIEDFGKANKKALKPRY
jgi:hypothetical protein